MSKNIIVNDLAWISWKAAKQNMPIENIREAKKVFLRSADWHLYKRKLINAHLKNSILRAFR